MNKFYVIEGVDGAGKTETARSLEKKYNFKYYSTPPAEYKPIRNYISEKATPISRLLYYMAGNLDASEEMKVLLESNNIICDRYLFSTIISHSVREKLDWRYTIDLILPYKEYLLSPERIILLDIEPEEQIRRINNRNKGENNSSDKIILENKILRDKFRVLYINLAQEYKWPIINTTHRRIEDVVKEFIQLIEAP